MICFVILLYLQLGRLIAERSLKRFIHFKFSIFFFVIFSFDLFYFINSLMCAKQKCLFNPTQQIVYMFFAGNPWSFSLNWAELCAHISNPNALPTYNFLETKITNKYYLRKQIITIFQR